MLEGIDELRTAFLEAQNVDTSAAEPKSGGDYDETGHRNATDILFGASMSVPFQQVLIKFLPLKEQTDRLVGAYLRKQAVAAPFIHSGQFMRQYKLFWDDPSVSSPLWTSILFSIIHISSRTCSNYSIDATTQGGISFDTAAAHCLVAGAYHRPQPFAIEALLLYAQSICLTNTDMPEELAILFGTLVRLATTMGYHREPDRTPNRFSAFESEMRRRTWSMCMQLDLLISFQLGLPSNMQYPTWDTRPPTNLLEIDFDETSSLLPPARPATEPTGLLFYIAKHNLATVFEKILRHALSARSDPTSTTSSPDCSSSSSTRHQELQTLDRELRATFASIPAIFHPRRMSESIAEPPSLTVTRLCVSAIFQKCLCVLHRPYIIPRVHKKLNHGKHGHGSSDEPSGLLVCYTSATELVQQFLDAYKEFEPGGQLESERWFLGAITWHDFLLGCTALCLVVCVAKGGHAADPVNAPFATIAHQLGGIEVNSADIVDVTSSLDLLTKAWTICGNQSGRSKDTRKVRRLIEVVVLGLSGGVSAMNTSTTSTSTTHVPPSLIGQDNTSQPFGLAMPDLAWNEGDADWLWTASMTGLMDESEWSYMEQFLEPPSNGVMSIEV